MAGDFGVCRRFTKGGDEELRPAMHGQEALSCLLRWNAQALGMNFHSNREATLRHRTGQMKRLQVI